MYASNLKHFQKQQFVRKIDMHFDDMKHIRHIKIAPRAKLTVLERLNFVN